MGMFSNKTGAKYTEVSAVITRADGTVEDLGVIAKIKKETLLNKILGGLKNGRRKHSNR